MTSLPPPVPVATRSADARHGRATRLFHAALGMSILTQLGTSLVMGRPDDVQPGDLLFQVHRYSGFVAMALAVSLWITIIARKRGTEFGALFPWLSWRRLVALWQDTLAHLQAVLSLRMPAHEEDKPLPSAVHGLGLLLITGMAATGAIYGIEVAAGLHSPEPEGMIAMTLHLALANLVWVYLIAHAGLAVLHHLTRSMALSEMWSLKR